jgi:hypothetical protein
VLGWRDHPSIARGGDHDDFPKWTPGEIHDCWLDLLN